MTTQWFKVKCRFSKEFQDGTLKRVTEAYLVNAINHGEAEARIHKEVGEYVRGEFSVTSVAPYKVADIFFYDDADTFWACRVNYTSEDADSGKEKTVKQNFVVTAHNAKEAYDRIEESLRGLMVSHYIDRIEDAKLIEFFAYEPQEETHE